MTTDIVRDPWQALRACTPARIALGRAGDSLPTRELLNFGLAHAQARDAVHAALDPARLARDLEEAGFTSLAVHSAAADRLQYLRRPDLGRRLDPASRERLARTRALPPAELTFVAADGLSARAVHLHAIALLSEMRPLLPGWRIGPVVIAEQSRVALGDQIGELLGSELVAILIGERPGLSSPDSLGVYLTYAPRVGRTDAERNCISNIRPAGLRYADAAHMLHRLLGAARQARLSGVHLKVERTERIAPLPSRESH